MCKYTKEGEPVDFLQKSLRKFYTRTLGGRDYTIFEAIFLGLRLPLMLSLMPPSDAQAWRIILVKCNKDVALWLKHAC